MMIIWDLPPLRMPATRLLSSIYDVGGVWQSEVTSFLNGMWVDVSLDNAPVSTLPADASSTAGRSGFVPISPDTERRIVEAGTNFTLDVRASTEIADPAVSADTASATAGATGRQPASAGTVVIVPGATYAVSVPPGWPPAVETAPGVFVVTPLTEGDHTLVVSADRDGFDMQRAAVPVRAVMSVPVSVEAVLMRGGPDGVSHGLPAPADLAALLFAQSDSDSLATATATFTDLAVDFTLAYNNSQHQTAYRFALGQPTDVSADFPESFEGGHRLLDVIHTGGGSLLAGTDIASGPAAPGADIRVRVSAGDEPVRLTAVYMRQVEVTVLGDAYVVGGSADGSGGGGASGSVSYQYGDTVTIAAAPGHLVPFLVPERVAYWTGLTGGQAAADTQTVRFAAESDTVVQPILEPDFTRLYVLLAGGAAVIGAALLRRFGPALSYRIGELTDTIRGGLRGSGAGTDSEGDDDDGVIYEDYDAPTAAADDAYDDDGEAADDNYAESENGGDADPAAPPTTTDEPRAAPGSGEKEKARSVPDTEPPAATFDAPSDGANPQSTNDDDGEDDIYDDDTCDDDGEDDIYDDETYDEGYVADDDDDAAADADAGADSDDHGDGTAGPGSAAESTDSKEYDDADSEKYDDTDYDYDGPCDCDECRAAASADSATADSEPPGQSSLPPPPALPPATDGGRSAA